jgi:hypothetical protein
MSLITLKKNPSPRDLKIFGWFTPIIFAALSIAFTYKGSNLTAKIFGSMALLLAICLWGFPATRLRLYRAWTYLTFPIGWVISQLVLCIFYFLILTPIGIIGRLFRKDPLGLKWQKETESYWQPRSQEPKSSDYFRQY